ncbi:MAG: hypothetical protein EPN74_05265 [Rhodanobacter sp.]|nr:MAG: hypothetical protein EPN74_05265 [Rhodanobacter sp.]
MQLPSACRPGTDCPVRSPASYTTRSSVQGQLLDNLVHEHVGNVATFPCSALVSGTTGEVTHLDAGYNVMTGS